MTPTRITSALAVVLVFLLCGSARAQQLPDAPTRRLNLALYAADLTLHTLDVATTYSQMNDRCRCHVESNPIAPSGKRLAPLLAFQYGYGAAAIFASHELTKHRHPFLGRVVLLWDVGDEAYSVQNNLRQHGHTAAPRGSWRPL
jgi:hypothetical protein